VWDVHGAGAAAFGFQWQRCSAGGDGCTDIPGATGATYDLGAADVGARVRVRVTGTNGEGATDAHSAISPVVATRSGAATGGGTAAGSGDGTGASASSVGAPGSTLVTTPDLRPEGSPNGTGASAEAKLTAFDAATESRSIRTRYGKTVTISGRLLTPGGKPISGARLEVLEQELRPGAGFVKRGEILSGEDGRFTYIMPVGTSRVVRVGYRARVGDDEYARTTNVTVRVVAAVRFSLSAKNLRNGQTLRYTGKVLGPRTGHRFVEVQVRSGKAWQVVCSVRTDAKGAFACAHRFRRTHARTTYVFRTRLRQQSGMPYEAAVSASRNAVVRP
jgi:hypothetical protein